MSASLYSVPEAVQRLSRRDLTLKGIRLSSQRLTDAELVELVDCLLAHPDVATSVILGFNPLTDETGVKLARYLAASSTIESLSLGYCKFGSGTYLALAAALRVNTSLCILYLSHNQAVDRTCIDAAFIEALRLNPDRPAESVWQLYSSNDADVDFKRLKTEAEQLGHPSLQLLLMSIEDLTTNKNLC